MDIGIGRSAITQSRDDQDIPRTLGGFEPKEADRYSQGGRRLGTDCELYISTFHRQADIQPGIAWSDVVKSFDLPGLVHSPHAVPLLTNIILFTPQNPVPAVAGLLPASIDAPLWDNINSLLAMVKGITDKPPDHFPIFTQRESSNPATFARVVDPPSHDSKLPEQAQIEADELQCAGIYNIMGFIVVIVAVFEMGEADESNAGLYDAVQVASVLLDSGFQVAPELVILGLEKLGVSRTPSARQKLTI